MANPQAIDLVRATATQLQTLLESGQLTSVDLVKESLAQIARHNEQGLKLKAVISVAPKEVVLARAAKLDAERPNLKSPGPFYGIPILLKVMARSTTS